MPDEPYAELAADAFIYGYPLIYDLGEVGRIARHGLGAVPPTPLNTFGHARALAGPDEKFVSINNDTLYSIANVDASGGPVRLDVPDSAGRYYVMQFVDAWTNNFAYVGHRATGTAAASFLLVAPGWDGDAPADATVIRLPTAIASIVGRWAVDGDADLPAVHALQDALRLTPTAPGAGLPMPGEGVPDDLMFFEELRVLMQAFPPADRDRAYQARFAPLGLLEPESPYPMPGPALHKALEEGLAAGRRVLAAALKGAGDDTAERVAADVPRLRLQPRLLRGGRARRRPLEAAGRPHPLRAPGRGRAGRAVGQPRLRGRLRDGLRGRRRRAPRRHAPLRAALRRAAALRGVLVGDDVRRAGLLPGAQPHRPLLDRRPHPRPGHRRATAR